MFLSKFIGHKKGYKPAFGALEIIKFIGPGLLVTIGFIDPGNWASDLGAGGDYGYTLLWVITLSTIILVFIQHNVAQLGIVTGLCLSEAATVYTPKMVSRPLLGSAMIASVSTSLAEIAGAAIALNMLFHVPVKLGAFLVLIFVTIMLLTNTYSKIEKWIIAFVSLIGISFIYELFLVDINWGETARDLVIPVMPRNSIIIIMSLLGAVVMPHNLFLHSEIIQSRQWNLKEERIKKRQLNYELFDTLFSMIVGWAINSAMIIMAAALFFRNHIHITELQQSAGMLKPLLGNNASNIFAIALLFAGVSSSITSGMAGGSIFSGMFNEPYDIDDHHSRIGVLLSLIGAFIIFLFIQNPFKGLIFSQIVLSVQLPFTVFLQIYLTSSKKVMEITSIQKLQVLL